MRARDCRAAFAGEDALCLDHGVEGSFCGSSCEPWDPRCPEGFTCEELSTGAGALVGQCVPEGEGLCACEAPARERRLETHCIAVTPQGACPGVRSCGPEGLGSCEVSVSDHSECADLCTEERCEARGDCARHVREGWCMIGGACFPSGSARTSIGP